MRIEYANAQVEKFHAKYGPEQPKDLMKKYEACRLMMVYWNGNGLVSNRKRNTWFHVGDTLQNPDDYLTRGWQDWDHEIATTGKSWWEVYVSHIKRPKWERAIDLLEEYTKLDPEDIKMILLTILKEQVAPSRSVKKDKAIMRRCEALLEKEGYDFVVLKVAAGAQDKKGIDYMSDEESDELVYVQSKTNYETWLKNSNIKGQPQYKQRARYDELAQQAPLYIYDEATDKLIKWAK